MATSSTQEELDSLRALLKEEQRRREEAEIRAEGSRLQSLQQYLDRCHSLLSLSIHVETDPLSTTQGDTTNPTGRVFPRRIVPWHDFSARQEHIWGMLADQPFCDHAIFPSPHQLDYVASLIRPITSETDLRHFARDTVEVAVQKLVDAAYDDEQLRTTLALQGSVTFESHTNLGGGANVDALTESIEQMDMTKDDAQLATPPPKRPPRTRPARNTKKGKRGPADQFCVYRRRTDGRNVPALAIEYKAPHKLTRDEVVTGLKGEIQPERDVINIHGQGFDFASKWLVAAVITQLFSYMVDKGIPYGYVCTGETFVFVYIPEDPSIVYYSVCVPNLDVMEDDEDRLHRTAVAQVFAFVLQALRSPSPPLPQDWHDRAMKLGIWDVEFEDVLRGIPATDRKPPKDSPLYKPQRWKPFIRSPIKTRSRCQPKSIDTRFREKSDSDDDNGNGPASPSASRSLRSSAPKSSATSTTARGTQRGGRSRGRGGKPRGQNRKDAPVSIQDRPFCTQKCLLGLASGGDMDDRCPNFSSHPEQHIEPSVFRCLLLEQLAKDRGSDADAMPLYLSGSIGALFKVRLSSHGYTLVAKGVEENHLARLQHEYQVYDWLSTIQGKHVPVCLGKVDLVLPYYYDGGVFTHFLLLSWAGRPLFDIDRGTAKDTIISMIKKAFQAIHELKVLHRDAEPRNVLYDSRNGSVMIVDFERAELIGREPLGVVSPNKKRKLASEKKGNKDKLTDELLSITLRVKQYMK
ncbi:hypothetical protein F4825DRAFT_442461 [Nemania diffusa]|nr:hypothetical protein F4825DRAFT_442461 [Nemania diffusa]